MAKRLPKPDPRQPLLDVLAQNNLTITEMNQMLQDGADEIERLLPKLLEKANVSGRVKAAQLALVRKELRAIQSALWGDLGRSTRQGVEAATLTAASSATDLLLGYLGQHGVALDGWADSFRAQAQQGLAAVLGKSKLGIPLARSVYKAQALSMGLVDRTVARGLLLGHNAETIAKSVSGLINPDVKGGVSYAAHRLARTEINHAYQEAQAARYQDEPWVRGMKWNLSNTHPRPDVCNSNATEDLHKLGRGVYPIGSRPDSHPNCLCYQTVEQQTEDDFVESFLKGSYNSYIDEQLYTYADRGGLPCP